MPSLNFQVGVDGRERPLMLGLLLDEDATEAQLYEPSHMNSWYSPKLHSDPIPLATFRIQHELGDKTPTVFLTVMAGCNVGTVTIDGKRYELVEAQ